MGGTTVNVMAKCNRTKSIWDHGMYLVSVVCAQLCSPRDDIRRETDDEGANEDADLLGRALFSPLLLRQAALLHAARNPEMLCVTMRQHAKKTANRK